MVSNFKIPEKNAGMLLSGDGIFYTLQGEGISIGKPAVFIRLHLCNLACHFVDGSICDAWYTWKKDTKEYQSEGHFETYENIVTEVCKYNTNLMVITGGEPMIQQDNILELMRRLPDTWKVEIETNATLRPSHKFHSLRHRVVFNCSPKLSNSGNSLKRSINSAVIDTIKSEYLSTFKFVVTNLADLDEVAKFVKEHKIPDNKIIIMPEGVTTTVLKRRMREISEYVKDRNWRLTPRLQFFIWGNKRRT